jgi:hypothetical protein
LKGNVVIEAFPGERYEPPRPLHPAVEGFYRLPLDNTYNAGVAQGLNPNEVDLIARQADAAPEGQPDSGNIVRVTLRRKSSSDLWDPSNVQTIHRMEDSDETYEDFRVSRQTDGSIVACGVGVRQVETERGTDFIPHPVDWIFNGEDGLGKLVLGQSLRRAKIDHQPKPLDLDGKNYTSVEPGVRLLRLEGEANNHRLHVIQDVNGRPQVTQIVSIPKAKWSESKAGTGAPPIKLDYRSNNFLIPLHGFGPKAGVENYYSCSYGVLLKDKNGYSIPWVDPEALIDPNMFPPDPNVELHAKRRVTYNCGLIEGPRDENGRLSYFDSVVTRGDRESWIVRVNCERLRERIQAGLLEQQARRDLARMARVPLGPLLHWS